MYMYIPIFIHILGNTILQSMSNHLITTSHLDFYPQKREKGKKKKGVASFIYPTKACEFLSARKLCKTSFFLTEDEAQHRYLRYLSSPIYPSPSPSLNITPSTDLSSVIRKESVDVRTKVRDTYAKINKSQRRASERAEMLLTGNETSTNTYIQEKEKKRKGGENGLSESIRKRE